MGDFSVSQRMHGKLASVRNVLIEMTQFSSDAMAGNCTGRSAAKHIGEDIERLIEELNKLNDWVAEEDSGPPPFDHCPRCDTIARHINWDIGYCPCCQHWEGNNMPPALDPCPWWRYLQYSTHDGR